MSHPDNTFKALRGEEQFVDRWQCRIGWHRWGKWRDANKDGGSLRWKQHRTCTDCGRQELKEVLGNARAY